MAWVTAAVAIGGALLKGSGEKGGGGGGGAFVQQQPDSLAKKLKDIEGAAPQGEIGPEGAISRGTESPEVTASRRKYRDQLARSLIRAGESTGDVNKAQIQHLLGQAMSLFSPQPSESPVRIQKGRLG